MLSVVFRELAVGTDEQVKLDDPLPACTSN